MNKKKKNMEFPKKNIPPRSPRLRVSARTLLVSFIFLTFTSCLQPDAPVIEKQELEIRQYGKPVSIIDIDPFNNTDDDAGRFFVYDIASDSIIDNALAFSNTGTVRVQPQGSGFFITGEKPSGMGIVTFTSGDKTAELRVFVRNWNASEVFRHTLYADLENYPFDPDVEYHSDHYLVSPPIANKRSAYQLIVNRGFHYEAPDGLSHRQIRENVMFMGQPFGTTRVHADAPRQTPNRSICPAFHIIQIPDPFLKKDVFSFSLHYENDGDMVGGFEDRQRLELKTMDTGQASYPGAEVHPENFMYSTGGGDTFTYRWKFRIPEDFRVSNEYTHIHQIKPEGGDSGNPTFTLTGRLLRATGREVLQLIYRGPIRDNGDPSVNWYPAEVPLEPFKGEWIRAETTITFDNPGTYRIRLVRIRDMRVLLEYIHSPEHYEEPDPFVMFRNGNSYIRPKFGVYRRVMHMTPFGLPDPDNPVLAYLAENNEVTVLFADIEMDKLR